jgi:hypothetical protein
MEQRGQDDQGQPYEPTRSRSGDQPQWGTQPPQWAQQPGQPQYGDQQPYQGQPGPQPGWQGAPQQPAPKKKSKLGCGCLSVVGAVVLIVIIAAAVSSGSKSNNTAANVPAAVTTTQAAGGNAVAAPTTQDLPAAPAKTVVLKVSGSGIKNTKSFTTGDDWSIKYSFNCASFGSEGNFQVYVYTDDQLSDAPVNELSKKGSDVTYEHGDSGKQYLEINSECSWSVTVTDGDSGN